MACDITDVFNLLISGEKIKSAGWEANTYIHMVNCDIVDQDGNSYVFRISGPDAGEWETFEPTIEKGYYHNDNNYTLVYYDGTDFTSYNGSSWVAYSVPDETLFLDDHTLILASSANNKQVVYTVVSVLAS